MLYLAMAAIVVGVNLLPALGPPTWAVLVLLKLHWHLDAVIVVAAGACSAAAGRYVLARTAHGLRRFLSTRRLDNLEAARGYLTRHRSGAYAGLALFTLSPLPSAQLFEAAGLLAVPLVPLTAAFFVGRLVSYSGYVALATVAQQNFGDVVTSGLKSPVGITVQVALLVGMAALTLIDPRRVAARIAHRRRP